MKGDESALLVYLLLVYAFTLMSAILKWWFIQSCWLKWAKMCSLVLRWWCIVFFVQNFYRFCCGKTERGGGRSKQIYLCWVYILHVYECSWCSGCFRRRKISCTGAFLWLKKVPERNLDVKFFHGITNHCAFAVYKNLNKIPVHNDQTCVFGKMCLESNVVIQISRITISISLSTLRTYVYTIHVRSHVE